LTTENRIDAVIFDLGRVIVDIDLSRLLSTILGENPSGDIEQIIIAGLSDKTMHMFNIGRITADQFHRQLTAKFGFDVPYPRFVKLWCSIFSPMPHMDELIRSLSGRVRLGLLSDTDVLHWNYLRESYPVLGLFEKPTLSFEVGTVKPDPAIFLRAAKNVDTAPEKCLYIDDLKRNVDGAIALGFDGVVFQSAEQLRTEFVRRDILQA
jgi:putative hydrolase of the HAD superfamily